MAKISPDEIVFGIGDSQGTSLGQIKWHSFALLSRHKQDHGRKQRISRNQDSCDLQKNSVFIKKQFIEFNQASKICVLQKIATASKFLFSVLLKQNHHSNLLIDNTF